MLPEGLFVTTTGTGVRDSKPSQHIKGAATWQIYCMIHVQSAVHSETTAVNILL